jgi:hypothetical protein
MQRSLAIEEALTNAETPISYIRLRGLWLRQIGFEPGDRVEVRVIAVGVLELRASEKRENRRLSDSGGK